VKTIEINAPDRVNTAKLTESPLVIEVIHLPAGKRWPRDNPSGDPNGTPLIPHPAKLLFTVKDNVTDEEIQSLVDAHSPSKTDEETEEEDKEAKEKESFGYKDLLARMQVLEGRITALENA